MKLTLLTACSGILAHVEEKYAVLSLHVDFVKKNQTAQLSGVFKECGLRGTVEETNYYAGDTVFPLLRRLLTVILVL